MALPTVNVTVRVTEPGGAVLRDATVTAMLNKADRDLGTSPPTWVLPSLVTARTNSAGEAVLAIWPNARGGLGSSYRWIVTGPDGDVLLDMLAAVPGRDCTLAELAVVAESFAPWPAPDTSRATRLVQDIGDLLAESSPSVETRRKVRRWIDLVLQFCEAARPWRFSEALVEATMERGVDQFDIAGDLRSVMKVWGRYGTLTQVPLSALQDARAQTVLQGGGNGGQPQWYAMEGQRRVHLFPVPREEVPLALLYLRPLTVEMIPDEMEFLVLNGVLGRYGRHFDRDALSQDAPEFEARFQRELRLAGRSSWDVSTWSHNLMLREPLIGTVPRIASGQVRLALPDALSDPDASIQVRVYLIVHDDRTATLADMTTLGGLDVSMRALAYLVAQDDQSATIDMQPPPNYPPSSTYPSVVLDFMT